MLETIKLFIVRFRHRRNGHPRTVIKKVRTKSQKGTRYYQYCLGCERWLEKEDELVVG